MSEEASNLYTLTDNLDKTVKLTQEVSLLFYNGFSKLIQKERDILNELAKGFKDSPLREVVPLGIEKLQKSDFHKDNFTSLVLAVTSIYGAIHDALYEETKEITGEKIVFHDSDETISFEEYNTETRTLLDNIQTWLIDIAIRGFSDLNSETIISFETVLQTLEEHKELKRLGVILRGFTNEILLVLSDTKDKDHTNQMRWMDLWCKAYLLTIKKQVPQKGIKVTGNLKLVGLQTYVHRNFFTIIINGILEYKKENIYVEIEKSRFIIDLIPLEEFWNQLKQKNQDLFDSLFASKIISIKDGLLFQNGNLILNEYTVTSKIFSLSDDLDEITDKNSLFISKIQAVDRHPIHFKIPIVIKEEEIEGKKVKLGNRAIPIRFELQPMRRISSILLKNKILMELRFDNGWYFKPLTLLGGVNQFLGQIAEKPSVATPIYSTLKERSSKILRDKK